MMFNSLHSSVSVSVSRKSFKMMMIGDVSAGKSDMMARYFEQENHTIYAELKANGLVE
jgi:GTPase SAR1 family protein